MENTIWQTKQTKTNFGFLSTMGFFIYCIIEKIKMWDFGEIDIPEDVTEVEYPFVFAPN